MSEQYRVHLVFAHVGQIFGKYLTLQTYVQRKYIQVLRDVKNLNNYFNTYNCKCKAICAKI